MANHVASRGVGAHSAPLQSARVLMQSGWSKLGAGAPPVAAASYPATHRCVVAASGRALRSRRGGCPHYIVSHVRPYMATGELPDEAYTVGPMPHDWLLPTLEPPTLSSSSLLLPSLRFPSLHTSSPHPPLHTLLFTPSSRGRWWSAFQAYVVPMHRACNGCPYMAGTRRIGPRSRPTSRSWRRTRSTRRRRTSSTSSSRRRSSTRRCPRSGSTW